VSKINGFVEVSSDVIKKTVPAALNSIKLDIIHEFANDVNRTLTKCPTIRCGFLWLRTRKRTYEDVVDSMDSYDSLEELLRYKYEGTTERLRDYLSASKLNDTVLVNSDYAWYFTGGMVSKKEIEKYTDYSFDREKDDGQS